MRSSTFGLNPRRRFLLNLLSSENWRSMVNGLLEDERTLVIASGYALQGGLCATRLMLRMDPSCRSAQ